MNVPVRVGKPSDAFKADWINREDRVVIKQHYFPNTILELEDLWLYGADQQSSATAQRILCVRNSLDPQHDEESVGRNPKSIKPGTLHNVWR